MPELPELQAHAERLQRELGGVELSRFEPLTFTALKTAAPTPQEAHGTPLAGVARRGKYLLLRFAAWAPPPTGDGAGAGDALVFVVHLMQGGRLRLEASPPPAGKRPTRGAVARWRFADGRGLLLTEPGTERKAGVWVVDTRAAEPGSQPPLSSLGPEADTLDAAALHGLFSRHSMRLHSFLRDQHVVAGLGRRLANEICWQARVSPFVQTRSLGEDGADVVARAIAEVLAEGLAAERARAEMSASRERPGAVHGRTGEACPRCGDAVRAVEYRGYTVNYCATCQTAGKVLADRTTSRFLK